MAHLTQNMHSLYAQDDWKVLPKLTLNLGLRWEYGSPYADLYNRISNFDPVTQTVLTTTPGAVAGNGITPFHGGGTYGKTLVNPDFTDFGPRVGFAYALDSKTAIRGGFGISYAHYTRAGSGDILGINAPQAQFASVTQITPTTTNHCSTPLPAQIIAIGTTSTTPSCYATSDQGYPSGLVTSFNPATDNITYIPKNTKDSYVESYFLSIQRTLAKNTLLDIAYVGNHGVKLQGFVNANQKNPAAGFARPYGNWPSDITAALNEFYSNFNSLQVKYEQQFVAGLTLLNTFTWEHALDNASASLEGNTPSLQDGNNPRADYCAVGLQPARRQHHQPRLRAPLRSWPPLPQLQQWRSQHPRWWLAGKRHRHHAGRDALQYHLRPQRSTGRLAPDLGDLSAVPTSIVPTRFPVSQ